MNRAYWFSDIVVKMKMTFTVYDVSETFFSNRLCLTSFSLLTFLLPVFKSSLSKSSTMVFFFFFLFTFLFVWIRVVTFWQFLVSVSPLKFSSISFFMIPFFMIVFPFFLGCCFSSFFVCWGRTKRYLYYFESSVTSS